MTPRPEKNVYGIYVMDEYDPNAVTTDLSYEKDLSLIAEYKRKPQFDGKQTRSASLYAQIANHFKTQGHDDMNAEKCSNRMGSLSDQFKIRYDQVRLGKTGIGDKAMNWVYCDAMSQLFEDSAILEPSKLISFGTSNTNTTRNQRVSPSQVKQEFLAEFKRFNNLVETDLQKKKES